MRSMTRILLMGGLLGAAWLGYPGSAAAQRSGVEIWAQNCGRCHQPQPANRYTATQWETIIMNMRLVARLTDAESEAVLEFLKGGSIGGVATAPTTPAPSTRARELASAELLAVALGPGIDPDAAYAKLCQPCHGASGKGDGPVARALNPRPANLSDPKVLGRSDEDIAAAIRDGKGTMPGFAKQLAADDISALVLYLRALVAAKTSGNVP